MSENDILQCDPDLREWKDFLARTGIKSIDIPITVTIGAVTIVGILRVRDPIEDSSFEGICIGVISGTINLDKNRAEAKLYDPTGQLFRLVITLDLKVPELKARLDTRRFDGRWSKGSDLIIWRG